MWLSVSSRRDQSTLPAADGTFCTQRRWTVSTVLLNSFMSHQTAVYISAAHHPAAYRALIVNTHTHIFCSNALLHSDPSWPRLPSYTHTHACALWPWHQSDPPVWFRHSECSQRSGMGGGVGISDTLLSGSDHVHPATHSPEKPQTKSMWQLSKPMNSLTLPSSPLLPLFMNITALEYW